MGSCSIKSEDQSIKSIRVEPIDSNPGQNHRLKPKSSPSLARQEEPVNSERATHDDLLTIKNAETVKRKGRKNLTVLTTNEDNIELPAEFSREKSLRFNKNEAKHEQGSLLVVRNPVQIGGRPSLDIQINFEEKLISIEGENVKRDFLLEHGTWVCCKKGMKPESPNQDDFVIIVDHDSILLGVFDGHGNYGHEISNYVHNALPRLLFSHIDWEDNPLQSYLECFPKVHSDLVAECDNPYCPFDCMLSGCTATVVTMKKGRIYSGHVGDSRAILCKRVGDKLVAQELTRDHKPGLEDEKKRIMDHGGEVKRLDGDIPERLFKKDMTYPGIAMSRAIGDNIAQSVGLSCIPEVSQIYISEGDEIVIVCSDGVWEFISSQEAADVVGAYDNPKSAAEALARLAWNNWVTVEGDVVDDITVIVSIIKGKKN